MLPNDNLELFRSILIGSWALRVYQEYFNNDPRIPIVATQDLDFLLENPTKVSRPADIAVILAEYGMEEECSISDRFAKFVGVDLEVEFLFPEKGRGASGGVEVRYFGIVAQPLRYLHFIQDYSTMMEYQSIPVRLPEPAVFVLMKYLLTIKRTCSCRWKMRVRRSNHGVRTITNSGRIAA